MSWIRELQESSRELEPPQEFFFWAGASAIAGVVKGNVFLDKFSYYLYPNIYVMLIANSGLRKGVPISYAKRLVNRVGNNRVISGRNSIQAVILNLSKVAMGKNGKTLKDATGYLVSGEFTNLLVHDPTALNILTDLYDTGYHDEDGWTNTLKGSPAEKLKNVNLTMIGATNPAHFREVIATKDVEGGFIARTFLIYAEEKHVLNPLTRPPACVPDVDELAKHLKAISEIKGSFTWLDDARDLYDKWYIDYNEKRKKGKVEDRTGTSNRFEDHVLKVAMILSLSKGPSLTLTKEDIEDSLEVCFSFLLSINKLMLTSGESKKTSTGDARVVLTEILKAPDWVSRKQILSRNWGQITSADLAIVVDTFLQGGMVEEKVMRGDQHYRLTEYGVKLYTEG